MKIAIALLLFLVVLVCSTAPAALGHEALFSIAPEDEAKIAEFYEVLREVYIITNEMACEKELFENANGSKSVRFVYQPVNGASLTINYMDGTLVSYQLSIDTSREYAASKSGHMSVAFGSCFCGISINESYAVMEYLLAAFQDSPQRNPTDGFADVLTRSCVQYGYKHTLAKDPLSFGVIYSIYPV